MVLRHSVEEWGVLSERKSCSWELTTGLEAFPAVCVYVWQCADPAESVFLSYFARVSDEIDAVVNSMIKTLD